MKPILLVGKPGIGKTYSVEKIAEENKNFLVEYNTSDKRTASALTNLSSSHSYSATGKIFLYLFDEVDGMDKSGIPILTKFLKEIEFTKVPVYLTANNLQQVDRRIQSVCKIELVKEKSVEEISEILKFIYSDKLGFSDEVFNNVVQNSAKQCKGDIRKAQQLLKYNQLSEWQRKDLTDIDMIKMILYDEDRLKVYKHIRQFPISSIYSWLFESFAINRKKEIVKKLTYLNRMLPHSNSKAIISDDLIYLFIAYELPIQMKPFLEKLPSNIKMPKIEEGICKKIQNHYNCSKKESIKYLYLTKNILNDKFCVSNIVNKCNFKKNELKHLGLDDIEPKKSKPKSKINVHDVLNY